jgi:hypothetical protein
MGETAYRPDGHPVVPVTLEYIHRVAARYARKGWMPLWVVYRPGTEYGAKWVVRCWVTLPEPKATRLVMTHDTLGELREQLPPGLACLSRHPGDHPSIEETWL